MFKRSSIDMYKRKHVENLAHESMEAEEYSEGDIRYNQKIKTD